MSYSPLATPAIPPLSMDRRNPTMEPSPPGVERRQFGSSYQELSPAARELANAVDTYKVRHRRRFVTYEEILFVVESLGYRKS